MKISLNSFYILSEFQLETAYFSSLRLCQRFKLIEVIGLIKIKHSCVTDPNQVPAFLGLGRPVRDLFLLF